MSVKWLNYLLAVVIALQSLSALGDVHQYHPFVQDAVYSESENRQNLDDPGFLADLTLPLSAEEGSSDCEHCCHCHSLPLIIPSSAGMGVTSPAQIGSGFYLNYQFLPLCPDNRPPIV
jgi:hypothetical protein